MWEGHKKFCKSSIASADHKSKCVLQEDWAKEKAVKSVLGRATINRNNSIQAHREDFSFYKRSVVGKNLTIRSKSLPIYHL